MQAVVTLFASPPKHYDAETTHTFASMCMNDCMNGKDIVKLMRVVRSNKYV